MSICNDWAQYLKLTYCDTLRLIWIKRYWKVVIASLGQGYFSSVPNTWNPTLIHLFSYKVLHRLTTLEKKVSININLFWVFHPISGQSPFNCCDEDELFWSICNEQAFFPKFLSKEAVQLLTMVSDQELLATLMRIYYTLTLFFLYCKILIRYSIVIRKGPCQATGHKEL